LKRSIRLSAAAGRDLERLADFLGAKSERAATRAVDLIASAVMSLEQFAERGYPSKRSGWRELSVRFGRSAYIVRYRIDGDSVFVTRIFHGLERR
jgi:plasmid stabilization system protein ParE